jgi:biopolymer transport protein ExbD
VDSDPLFVNMDREGNIIVWGEKKTLEQAKFWLRDQYEDARKAGRARTTVILRAHRKTKLKLVKQLLEYCKEAGFQDVRVRAEAKIGKS